MDAVRLWRTLRGRESGGQAQSYNTLAVLRDAVVAWNIQMVEGVFVQLRAQGHALPDEVLVLTTPLLRKYLGKPESRNSGLL